MFVLGLTEYRTQPVSPPPLDELVHLCVLGCPTAIAVECTCLVVAPSVALGDLGELESFDPPWDVSL